MSGKSSLLSCLTLAAYLSITTGCGVGEASIATAEPPSAPHTVTGVSAYLTDLYATYQATSTLAADADAVVPARVPGEVVAILVEEGDAVVQGQLLARLDGQKLALQVEQSDARFTLASARFRRLQQLHERGLASTADFDSLEYEVDALAAELELDRLNLSYTEIRAPLTGVVSDRRIRLGQYLRSGDAAFRISDTSQLLTTVRVPQTELRHFRQDLPVTLRVDAAGTKEYAARVDRISPVIDRRDGTFRVTAYVDNNQGELAPGMFAQISVRYEKFADTLTLPASAVAEEDGRQFVYVIDGGLAEQREVVTGIRERGLVQIVSGIVAGENVINGGASGVRDGSNVVIMNPAIAGNDR